MRGVGHGACMEEMGNAYKILVGKPEGKRSFGRRAHRWEDNMRMNLRGMGWEVVSGRIWLRIKTFGGLL
jgi:hypothetical protein